MDHRENRLRFCAWDKQTEQMIHKVGLWSGDMAWGWSYDLEHWLINAQHSGQDRFDVMQCTGCIDIEGTDVFEGDIVDAGGNICVIKWEDCCYWLSGIQTEFNEFMSGALEVTVLGNIYENADLVKKSDTEAKAKAQSLSSGVENIA